MQRVSIKANPFVKMSNSHKEKEQQHFIPYKLNKMKKIKWDKYANLYTAMLSNEFKMHEILKQIV